MPRRALTLVMALVWLVMGQVAGSASATTPFTFPSAPCQDGWTIDSVPPVGNVSFLLDVEALSRTDVWAVGIVDYQGVAMHFDGRLWSVIPTPTTTGLYAVDAAASDDVWAVGVGPPDGPLAMHWDGTSWSSVPTPPVDDGGVLNDVTALGPDDVWAVGYTGNPEYQNTATLAEHWDGASWTIVPSPDRLGYGFSAGSMDAPTDGWAVGGDWVFRWDGSSWMSEDRGPTNSFLFDVVAFGPDDVWAAGETYAPQTVPAYIHWDGTAWTHARGPGVRPWGQIFGIGGPATDRLWAVGTTLGGVLMERWNGTSWRRIAAPSPPGTTTAKLQDVAVDAEGFGWAVGSTETYPEGQVMIERTCRS